MDGRLDQADHVNLPGDGGWYDVNDVDRLHADLAANPQATDRAIARRPALAAAHRDCAVCARIRAAAPTPAAGRRRRIKMVLRPSQLHQLLGLPSGHEVVFVYSVPDPNTVVVLIEGDDLEPIGEAQPAPTTTIGP